MALLASAVAVLLSACTAAGRRQTLNLFFDGVPPADAATTTRKPMVTEAAGPTAGPPPELPELYRLARAAPTGIRHRPYAERQCLSCHESQFSQTLRGEVAEICQLCHSSIAERGPHRHAPVEAGYCLGCHEPHESKERALLVRPVRQLCGECHDESQVMQAPHHAQAADRACDDCHDPHGGSTRTFLKGTARVPAPATKPEGARL